MAQINQQSTPSGSISVPASGSYAIFSEPTDLGRLYLKDSDGNVYPAVSGSGGGGSGLIPIQEDGVAVGNAQTLNFTGTGIDSVAVAASVATVTVSGGGGGAGTSGSSGSSGSSGAAGANGTSGSSGADGAAGADGSSGSSGANGAAGTSGSSGANGDAGTSGSSGSSGATGDAGTSGSSGANGAPGTSGSSGNDGAAGTSGISGTSGTSAAGGGATAYAVRINYDTNTEPDTSTQLTSSPWSSNSVTVTINSVTDVVFDFPSESAPPIAVNAYFYNANTDKYVLSTLGLGNNSYANGQGFTSTIAANQASNNFFSSFSTDSEIKLDLTANNYGGSKKNLPPVFVHCYLVFTFA